MRDRLYLVILVGYLIFAAIPPVIFTYRQIVCGDWTKGCPW